MAVEDKLGMEAISEQTYTVHWMVCTISEFMHDLVLLKDIGVCYLWNPMNPRPWPQHRPVLNSRRLLTKQDSVTREDV
jgi:hypothetical protein